MLTLDEAIARYKALSKANRSRAESYNRGEDYELMKAKECETCADECEQVASWLEELKRYKAQKLVIKVDYDKAHDLKELLRHSQFGIAYPDAQYEVVPLVTGGPSNEEYKRDCNETADMLQIILDDAESYKYGALGSKEGVLLKHISLKGNFEWVISKAIDIIRGVSI